MHRTQVYFEPEILELLKDEAKRKKITLAKVIREKVEKNLNQRKKRKVRRMNAAEFLSDIERLGKKLKVKGPKDLSQRIDEFVYR